MFDSEQEVTHKFQIQNFNRLIEHDESNQFQIVIKIPKDGSKNNNNNRFEVNTTLNKARILSKKINDIYLVDPTITKFEIKYCKKNNQVKELLEKIISSLDKEILITPDELQDYLLLMILLGEENDQFKLHMNSLINTIEEAISFLSTEFHSNSIYYLASHFNEFLSSSASGQISSEIFLEIIDTYFEYCDLKDEEINSVYEKLAKKNESANIVIHFLTRIDVSKLTTSMVDYIYDHLDDDILNSEMLRIISIVREHYFDVLDANNRKKQKTSVKQIEYKGNKLDEIFSFLKEQDGGELKKDTLVLSGGGNVGKLENLLKYDPENIDEYYINYADGIYAEEGDSWIKFDFCNKQVKLTSYTIRSDDWSPNSHHPMSWRFVGSNDGNIYIKEKL